MNERNSCNETDCHKAIYLAGDLKLVSTKQLSNISNMTNPRASSSFFLMRCYMSMRGVIFCPSIIVARVSPRMSQLLSIIMNVKASASPVMIQNVSTPNAL